MTLTDFSLFAKKIVIGIVVSVIPFVILFGGLRYVRTVLSDKTKSEQIDKKKQPKNEDATSDRKQND
jgi:hypothetical protein